MCVMEHVLAIDTLMLVLRDTVTAVNQCLHFVRVLGHSCQESLTIQEQLEQWGMCRNS